ncbi:hypothetical protein A176_001742 [Myxococcus hansupus]|uniref:Uncharacterized protein n=1 Tax=Pseudomyxococcus hansupus TaxID=1297742 RepID=A0A0H4WU43_9BACT|nr:hypothetical protein A176_001742 [Myxococcus hansupus]
MRGGGLGGGGHDGHACCGRAAPRASGRCNRVTTGRLTPLQDPDSGPCSTPDSCQTRDVCLSSSAVTRGHCDEHVSH